MTDLFTKPAKAIRLKASDIRAGMKKRWCDPQWAIMWEVGEGTGAMSGRYADAVMMSLWPSRGLELHGVEIKISRSDWKREAADPSKAEAIARYCDRWWVHTPPGIVDDLSDLPRHGACASSTASVGPPSARQKKLTPSRSADHSLPRCCAAPMASCRA